MSRTVTIAKVGKSTIVDVQENASAPIETFVFNKDTNLTLQNNVIKVESCENKIEFLFSEIVDKLTATNARGYLTKASEAFLFNH